MLLKLQPGIIYGPVCSRRLGCSMGINLLPTHKKVCSFNCLYCQYGLEESQNYLETETSGLPSVNNVLTALEIALNTVSSPPDYITFSGNGEATMHPHFREIVIGVKKIRDRLAPTAKTAILSNSTMVKIPLIREALSLLDVIIMKLDAGLEKVFINYNRPAKGMSLENIVSALASMKKITLQTLFSKGADGNYTSENVSAWIRIVKTISPVFVQIYTLDRESPTASLIPLERSELLNVRHLLNKENISAEVF